MGGSKARRTVPSIPKPPSLYPLLELVDLHKTYFMDGVSVRALRGVDLSFSKGEFTAIMGASGSGKSTLMNILGCLDKPTRGSYAIEGTNVSTFNKDELASIRNQKIGFVFQGFNLLSRTSALENVELPMVYANIEVNKRHQRAKDALASVGLAGREHHFPNQLSGGQQQRLCIARAIAMEPEVILMDEPCSALDPISTGKIEELMLDLKKEYTIIIVTHNMQQAARISDVTAFMYQGELIELGDTKKMFTRPDKKVTDDYITGKFG